jgi:hypothetical protein
MNDSPLLLKYHGKPGVMPLEERGRWPSGPMTDVGDYLPDELEFVTAVSHFRSINKIGCPTLCQLLWVLKQLGYRKSSARS